MRYFKILHSMILGNGAKFRPGIAPVEKLEDAVLLEKAKGVDEVSEQVSARRKQRGSSEDPEVKPRGRFFKINHNMSLAAIGKSFSRGVYKVVDSDVLRALEKAKGVVEVTEALQESELALFQAIDKILDAEDQGSAKKAAEAKAAKEAEAARKAAEQQADAEAKAAEKLKDGGEVPSSAPEPKLEAGEKVEPRDPPKKSSKSNKSKK